jgi:hypothetical protein
LFLLLRLVAGLGPLFALYVFGRGPLLALLLAPYLAAFSILQRLGSNAVQHQTSSAPAAAVFGAILAAWFAAAVFPLT